MHIVLVIARNFGRVSSVQSVRVWYPKLSVLFFFEALSAYVVQASTELMYSSNP